MATDQRKIVIVGGGPAGLATALHIARIAPWLAPDTLVLEAKQHPRAKVCGGGITVHGEQQLRQLGLDLDVLSYPVHRLTFKLDSRSFSVEHPNAMRIIERAEFDAALADSVAACGIPIYTGEKLQTVSNLSDGMELVTNRGIYHAQVVVAADGANSTLRRKLGMFNTVGVARLLRSIGPVEPHHVNTWKAHTAVFDFTCVRQGVQGYMWDFPCYQGGEACMNRGIFDSRILPQPVRERANLKQTFALGLQSRDLELNQMPLDGHPVRWFNPRAEFARPHVLLTGDAAGVDPLFAEGISYAMEYGAVAAETIRDAFEARDFRFTDYRDRLVSHRLGRLLMRRTFVARTLYQHRFPPVWTLLWFLAGISPARAQRAMGAALALLPA